MEQWRLNRQRVTVCTFEQQRGDLLIDTPLEDKAIARRDSTWIDRHNRNSIGYAARTTNTADHIPGTIPVLTYRDYFTEYRAHPEHKALGPDGKLCHAWTRGLLKPPTVEAAPTLLRIGKESLPAADDDPDPSEPIGPEIIYTERVCPACGEALADRQETCSDRCRKRLRGCRASRLGGVDRRGGSTR